MKVSLSNLWEDIHTSFWFVPTLMTFGALVLSIFTLGLDEGSINKPGVWWIYSGEASGARSVLSVISGSMITVTSIVFSITIVALTLASGQFGSRLLRNYMRDTGNQVVLGTFIATFIYSLLILRSVRSEGENEFIPYISVTVGVLLVFISVGVLIYFIHHIATKIQAESIVSAIFEETTEAVDNQFPKELKTQNEEEVGDRNKVLPPDQPEDFYEEAYNIKAGSSNYLKVVECEKLLKLAEKHNLILEILYRPGDFIIRDSTMMVVWPPQPVDDALHAKLYDSMILGEHRTLTQNAEYGIQQLVEIAVRALSPGINDPFTAVNCIDRLAAILCQVARKQFPSPRHHNAAGKLRLIQKTANFEGYVETAFNQIRQNARSSTAVIIKLMEAIDVIISRLSRSEQKRVLYKHAEMIYNTGLDNLKERQDLQDLQARYDTIVQQ